MATLSEIIRESQIWKSIFRHPAPVDRRNRVVVMLTNFFLHLHPVSIKKQGIALSFTWFMGGVTFFLFLVETITGRHVEAVVAQLGYLHGRKTEDHAGLLIRFAGGMQGVCTLSQASAGRRNEVELSLDGIAGSATWHSERRDELWMGARGRAPAVVTRSSVRSAPARELTKRPPGADEGRRNLLAAFYATLDGKPSLVPLPTFADASDAPGWRRASACGRTAATSTARSCSPATCCWCRRRTGP